MTRFLTLLLLLGAVPLAAQAKDCEGYYTPLMVPEGFCVRPFADKVAGIRHLVVHPSGTVVGATKLTPGLIALRDTTGDGIADQVTRFGPGTGGTGLTWHEGWLYFAADIGIYRIPWPASASAPTGAGEWISEPLPAGGSSWSHDMKGIAIGKDGALYVSIGSASDNCRASDDVGRGPGLFPCPELPKRAGIWRFTPPLTGGGPWVGVRHASGLRNAMAITHDPRSGAIWAVSHGRDFLNRTWGWSDAESAIQPAEILVQVTEGADFGWPYCMGHWTEGGAALIVAPEYAEEAGAACAKRTAPSQGYPGHWAPMAIAPATAALPAEWRNGLFIAFHGSRSRAPLPEAGHHLVFQPLDAAGVPTAEHRIFLHTTEGAGKLRLAGVAIAPNGAIYVSDDDFGRVIRIDRR